MKNNIHKSTPLDHWIRAEVQTLLPDYYKEAPLRYLIKASQCLFLAKSLKHSSENSFYYKKTLAYFDLRQKISLLEKAVPENFEDLEFHLDYKSFLKNSALELEDNNQASSPIFLNQDLFLLHLYHIDLIEKCLKVLPFTLPSKLSEDSFKFQAVGHNEVDGISTVQSSGTSGKAKRIFSTHEDMEFSASFFQHGMKYLFEADPKPCVALLMSGDGVGTVGYLLKKAMAKLHVPCHVLGFPKDFTETIQKLKEIKPTCLVGVPGQIFQLARQPDAHELKNSLKTVLLSGDVAVPALRKEISQALGSTVYLHYGLTEFGLGGFVECPKHEGGHGRELDILVEIISQDGQRYTASKAREKEKSPLETMESFADGYLNSDEQRSKYLPSQLKSPVGEIVLSSLRRWAMPLIRYNTGDLGQLIWEDCPCGSKLSRIKVFGRKDNFIILPKNNTIGESLSIHSFEEALYPIKKLLNFKVFAHKKNENIGELALLLLYRDKPDMSIAKNALESILILCQEEGIKLFLHYAKVEGMLDNKYFKNNLSPKKTVIYTDKKYNPKLYTEEND